MGNINEISVVIPFFNAAAVCNKLIVHLAGFLNQKGISYEFIIVDDGSSRVETQHLISLLTGRDKIRLYKIEKNAGQYTAIAFGLSVASGKLLIIADQDTPLIPHESLTQLITENSAFDLKYIYYDHYKHSHFLRRLTSNVWHFMMRWSNFGNSIPGNPLPVRVLTSELSDRLKESNYLTTIIDLEMLYISNETFFFKDASGSYSKRLSNYTPVKFLGVIFKSICNIIPKFKLPVTILAVLLMLTVYVLTRALIPVLVIFAIISLLSMVVRRVNSQDKYEQQLKSILPGIIEFKL